MKAFYFLLTIIFTFLININFAWSCGCEKNIDSFWQPWLVPCKCRTVETYSSFGCNTVELCGYESYDSNGPHCFQNGPGGNIYGPGYQREYCGMNSPVSENKRENPKDSSCEEGSIVKVQGQSLQENIPLLFSNEELVYSSERTFGYASNRSTSITISQPVVENVSKVHLLLTGTQIAEEYSANTDHEYNYTWNGLNGLNNEVIDGPDYIFEFEYEYNNSNRIKVNQIEPKIGFYNLKLLGLGGFSISNVHFYNTKLKKIHYGDGRDVAIEAIKINKTGDVLEKLNQDEQTFTHLLVAADDGSEAYVFSSTGYHLETRSTRTSKVLTSFSYDVNNRLVKIEDSFGNETLITRPNGTTVEIEPPSGKKTILTLNAHGFATKVKTPKNEEYIMTYASAASARGLMTSFQTPKGLISNFVYDSEGKLIEDTNNAGHSLELNVVHNDVNLKLIQAISAEGRITDYYSGLYQKGESETTKTKPSGAVEIRQNYNYYNSVTHPNTFNISSYRDQDPRFPEQSYFDTSETVYSHNVNHEFYYTNYYDFDESDLLKLNSYEKGTAFGTQSWLTEYDGLTQTYTDTSPLGRIQTQKLNDFDQLVESKYASFMPYEYLYNIKGQLSEIKQNLRSWVFSYNINNEIESITNPLHQITSYVYDDNGRVIETTHPNNEKTLYEYDEVGNLKRLKAGTKPWHELVTNLSGFLSKYIMPSLGGVVPEVQYTYNNDKQITQIKRENNDEINFTYGSASGMLENISTAEGNYQYINNLTTEQLTEIKGPLTTTRLQYTYIGDTLQIHRIREGSNNSSYRYDYSKMLPSRYTLRHQDSNSNVSHLVNLTYNSDRLLTKIGALDLIRTASTGLIEETVLGNVKEYYVYNSDYAEIENYYIHFSGTSIYGQAYTRDALGRTTYATEINNSSYYNGRTYGYDSRGRLERSGRYFTNEKVYSYDDNSNRIRVRDQNSKEREVATYNSHDQLLTYIYKSDDEVTVLKSYSYTYNDFGQRVSRTESLSNIKDEYTYNSVGALTGYKRINLSTSAVLKNITYRTDGLGRRLTKTVDGVLQTRYIYNEGIRLVGEVTPDGDTLTHYIYADKMHVPSYMVRGGVTYKFVINEQGSVRYVVNTSNGTIEQDIIYDEFGVVMQDTNPGFQPFGFAGGIYEPESGLTRFGARDYDAEVGRWTAKDLIRFEGGDTNLYGYVLQDPVNLIDPDGEVAIPLPVLFTIPATGPAALVTGVGALGYLAYDWWMNSEDNSVDPVGQQCTMNETKGGHRNNQRPSNREKHENADSRRQRDQGGEKGDKSRRPPAQKPRNWKGSWPPKG